MTILSMIGDDLFLYPIDPGDRLDGQYFLKWKFHRWLSSDLHLCATYEVQGMARTLFDLAQTQSPPGTLPDDQATIAKLLRAESNHFKDLCRRNFGPLHNWRPCRTLDGKRRLYHPVVLDQIQEAMTRRESRELVNTDKSNKVRKRRIVEALKGHGVSADVLADPVFVDRCDAWLAEQWIGSRTEKAYVRVVEAAAREKWFTPYRNR